MVLSVEINALTPGTVKFVHFPAGYGVRVEKLFVFRM